MKYHLSGFLNNQRIFDREVEKIPRKGDLIRLKDLPYILVVADVLWCFDLSEINEEWVRVNLIRFN